MSSQILLTLSTDPVLEALSRDYFTLVIKSEKIQILKEIKCLSGQWVEFYFLQTHHFRSQLVMTNVLRTSSSFFDNISKIRTPTTDHIAPFNRRRNIHNIRRYDATFSERIVTPQCCSSHQLRLHRILRRKATGGNSPFKGEECVSVIQSRMWEQKNK